MQTTRYRGMSEDVSMYNRVATAFNGILRPCPLSQTHRRVIRQAQLAYTTEECWELLGLRLKRFPAGGLLTKLLIYHEHNRKNVLGRRRCSVKRWPQILLEIL